MVSNELGSRPDTTAADGECPECEGTIWDLGGELVCGECSIVLGSDREGDGLTEWDHFFEDRPEHWNSEKPRCVGGFPWTYDWVGSDDVDGSVSSLNPENFYK